MSIKQIYINNLASFSKFKFDITKKDSNIQKYISIFGTNGSGKSSLVDMLQLLNKYKTKQDEHLLNIFKDFLSNKFSKEATDSQLKINIDFNNFSECILFDKSTNQINFTHIQQWQPIKIFNENYTNATIGKTVDINLKENGLIIGEPNIELNKERIKQKKLSEQKTNLEKEINEMIASKQKGYKSATGSNSQKNLGIISKENFLKDICNYKKDEKLISKRESLGTGKQEQISNIIDIHKINTFFNLEYWESLFQEILVQPTLNDEYKTLLIKYSHFYKNGIELNTNEALNDKCPYCLQRWENKDKTLDEFQTFLTSDYNQKKEKIDSLKNELQKFNLFLKEKNKEIKAQEKVVIDECKKYDVDYSNYSEVAFEETKIEKIISIIEDKINNMNTQLSIKESLENLQKYYFSLFEQSVKPLHDIKETLDKRQSLVMSLNTQIAEHTIKVIYDDKSKLRENFNNIKKLLEECSNRIDELEAKDEDINTIQEVFNGLLKFIGLGEYFLDSDNKLQLQINSSYDISNEGGRISTAQKKILSLCYFYAEIISEVTNERELKNYTLVYDDPLDSADYIFFHSITSLIENIESVLSKILGNKPVNFSQHIVFTHNSLLFNRLGQNFNLLKKINKVNQKTILTDAEKLESNYKLYIESICSFYKKENTDQREKIFIGNAIRRVLEILISFNELNNNNVSIIKDYGKPTLGMIANHLSHENFFKVLNPLPTDHEMTIACKELFEIIKENHPKQHEYIQKNLLI